MKRESRRRLPVWLTYFEAYLFVGVHVDVALDALLPHIGPTVPRHPLSLTLGALVLAKTALLALVRRQAFPLWPCLQGRRRKGLSSL